MNESYFVFYQSAMILSLLASLFVMALMWRCRQAHGAKAMIVLSVATFVWTLGFLFEANSDTLEQQLFFNNIGYIGSMSVPVAWFIFSLHYTSDNQLVTGWRIAPLCIIPLVTVALVWSNNWHHLMWFNEHLITSGPFTVTTKTYGSFFWIAFAYSYILIATGVIILIRRLFVGAPLYTGQAISLIVAVSLPLIWNFIYVFNLVPLPHKDLTPVMFAISGIAIALGLMRFQLFTAVPFARKFLIHQLNDGILVFDVRHRLLEVNPAALKILGMDKNIIGKGIEYLSLLSPVLERLFSTGFGSVELPLTISGNEHFYELETVPMYDNHERQVGWLAILHDITERKQMEEERTKYAKLESIGTLAGGIAHDFNNLLTGIMGYIGLAKSSVESGEREKASNRLLEAEKASLQAKDLTQHLLTFARGGAPTKKVAFIKGPVEDATLFALRGSNVRPQFSLPDDLWLVEIDEGQINQTITNIVINADEAMPEGGILHIGVKNTVIKRRGTIPLPRGNYVEITIKDNGIGIPKDILDKIFDPYFTTKQKGSGLGLSTTYSIVAKHDGHITVESELGTGTTFHIYLPASEKPTFTEKEAIAETRVIGAGKVLVMDDEKIIRELLYEELTDVGYEVELTVDGVQAIERYTKAKESGSPFDVVILDLTIPGGMGGLETIKKLLETAPDVKAIASSGYSSDLVMSKYRKYGFSGVLGKPYVITELTKAVDKVLQGKKK